MSKSVRGGMIGSVELWGSELGRPQGGNLRRTTSCAAAKYVPTMKVLKATLLLLGGNLLGSSINAR